MSQNHTRTPKEERLSVLLFLFTIASILLILCAAFAWLLPSVWQAQLGAGWPRIAGVFLIAHLFCSFGEFFFHRYVFHVPTFPLLSHFYKQHTLHHALTRVSYARPAAGQPAVPRLVEVKNLYPIEKDPQREASFFPWYSLLAFAGVVTPFLALLQWLLPTLPIVLGGWLGLAWTLTLYELLHAVEHLPQGIWDRLVTRPRTGRFWRKAYAFHLRHHADIRCNESVSGFFGFPLPDLIFGTYIDPETLYPHEGEIPVHEFKSQSPRFAFLRRLDELADQAVANRRLGRPRATAGSKEARDLVLEQLDG